MARILDRNVGFRTNSLVLKRTDNLSKLSGDSRSVIITEAMDIYCILVDNLITKEEILLNNKKWREILKEKVLSLLSQEK